MCSLKQYVRGHAINNTNKCSYSFKGVLWLGLVSLMAVNLEWEWDETYESAVWHRTYKICHVFIARIDTSFGYCSYLLWWPDMTTAGTDGTDGNIGVCVFICDCVQVSVIVFVVCTDYCPVNYCMSPVIVWPVRTYSEQMGFAIAFFVCTERWKMLLFYYKNY